MTDCLTSVADALNGFAPISLDEMGAVKLMNRTDTKFVINVTQLLRILDFARYYYKVQETLGERLIEYRTTYYDTADWRMLRAHTTGRKSRVKVRVRTYVGSNLTFIEVKRKNNHGRTKKKRIPVALPPSGALPPEALSFISASSPYAAETLSPAVGNVFRRVTLVNNEMTERLTIDLCLSLTNLRSGELVNLADTVIVEVKRGGRNFSHVVSWLHDHGVRKHGFSKYCYGALLSDSSLPLGVMKPKMHQLLRKGLIPAPVSSWRQWAA